MHAFAVDFRCYIVAADQGIAQQKVDLLRTTCESRGFKPGRGQIRQLSSSELARIPALMTEVERLTRPRFGPAATDDERAAALCALSVASSGDAGAASLALHAVEQTCGYLPRDMAKAMANKATPPEVKAA